MDDDEILFVEAGGYQHFAHWAFDIREVWNRRGVELLRVNERWVTRKGHEIRELADGSGYVLLRGAEPVSVERVDS